MKTVRLTLVLSQPEMQALKGIAATELRRPRDQARLILQAALGLLSESESNTSPGGCMNNDSLNAELM